MPIRTYADRLKEKNNLKPNAYSILLKDPRWQKKRLEIMSRDEFKCQFCLDDKKTLNIHHISYQGKNPWDTPDRLLITLCEDCHKEETNNLPEAIKDLTKVLKDMGMFSEGIQEMANNLSHFKERFWNYPPLWGAIRMLANNDQELERFEKLFFDYLAEKAKQNGKD